MFLHQSGAIVLVYVDDLMTIGTDDEAQEIVDQLSEYLKMKAVGTLEDGEEILYLGRILKRYVDTIYIIAPTAHIDKMVEILAVVG